MNKTIHSLSSNIRYTLAAYWGVRKAMIVWTVVGVIMRVALPFLGIMLPKIVIDELTMGATPEHFALVVGGISLLLIVVNYLKGFSDAIIDAEFGMSGTSIFITRTLSRKINMDFELLEKPHIKALEDKAEKAGMSNHTPAMNLPRNLAHVMENVLGLIVYGAIVSAINPWIMLLLAVSAGINWFVLAWSRKYELATRETRANTESKIRYVVESLKNPAAAKEIRLYSMVGWLKDVSDMLFARKKVEEGGLALRVLFARLTDGLLILARDSLAYAYLVMLLLKNQITLGDFVLVFAAIGAFAAWIGGIILESSELLRSSTEMSDLRAYCEVPDEKNTGVGAPLPPKGMALSMDIEGVSYTYPGAEKAALKDITVHIKPGERIAIVGANGAGKTTLVKLITGLFTPQSGRILVDGTDQSAFNRDEYFSLFSAVFQDIHLLAVSVLENISQRSEADTDLDRVKHCIDLAGLSGKVNRLQEGERTLLVREINEGAAELSGGEKQKLSLARAIYKDAPFIILDEPTAALDPIAENEIYQRYAELTEGKTSVYISHRLASTRFCDRILFISGNSIAEEGTHDELMRLGGQYAEMFGIQASYYAEKAEVTYGA